MKIIGIFRKAWFNTTRHSRTEFRATSLHAHVYDGLHVKYACKLDQQIGLRSPSKLISVPLVTRDPIRRAQNTWSLRGVDARPQVQIRSMQCVVFEYSIGTCMELYYSVFYDAIINTLSDDESCEWISVRASTVIDISNDENCLRNPSILSRIARKIK